MYTILLAKKQLKFVTGLWQRQHLQLITTSILNISTRTADVKSHATTNCKIQSEEYQLPPFALNNKRLYSQEGSKNVERLCFNEIKDTNIEEIDSLVKSYNIKNLLYTEEDDLMSKLNTCDNLEQIKDVLETEQPNLQKEHIVQSIILLWMCSKQNPQSSQQLTEQNIIELLIPLLSEYVPSLNINEMSSTYLYLRKMGVENTDPVLQQILLNALHEIEHSEEVIGLPALSRLIVGINTGKDFCTPMLCANFLKHIEHHIEKCSNEGEARMIAICMINLQGLVSTEVMGLYKKKVLDLLTSGEISGTTPKTVIKILHLLNMSVWSHQHLPLIRDLLLSLRPVVKQLDANDLKSICRIYQYHIEPASLHKPLAEAVEGLLSNQMSPEVLASFVPFSQPQSRETLINAFKALVFSPESWQGQNATRHLFTALRKLKVSDVRICNAYWKGVISKLETTPEEELELRFFRHCHRYMNFNNNLGGTYRHTELEKKLSQLCMRAVEHSLDGRIPEKFARLASFVFAYGHTPYSWKKYPNVLLSKIITMAEQFTPSDCFFISRGLQISLEMRYRPQLPQLVGMQLSIIDNVLSACAERFLSDEQLTVTDLNMLVRALSNRKSLKNSVTYHKALQRYKDIKCDDLNSRIIKDMTYIFLSTNYCVPEVLENMFRYLESNHEHIIGETAEKLLTCSYNLGYTPQSYEALQYAGDILLRDFDNMSGLSLIQACLALCFYRAIPEELINKVFCVNFIQRIEEEIQLCYSKATYPERVLNIVMQLNRSVCLDFPEANVPWFQQNFIEAQMSKKPVDQTAFSQDVKRFLTSLVKEPSYIKCNHTTPYGYQIDFVINFDKNKKPIHAPVETTMLDRITKVAILLLKLDSFCENDLNALRGPESMKIKHLEMMGYKVLNINEHDWNSKYMNVPGAKQNYLKCLLQISS